MAMKWIGKVAGSLLGALTLGPIGAALGLLLGHQFDEEGSEPLGGTPEELNAIGDRFFRATFRVMGYLAKADGRVSEQEIAAARAVMSELRLNGAQVQEAIACFTAGKSAGFDFAQEIAALRRACQGRRDLTRVFLELQLRAALAGNNLQGPARPLLGWMANALGLSGLEYAHLEAVARIQRGGFRAAGGASAPGSAPAARGALDEAYRLLETSAAASDQEVVKAYRRQLHRHHPDKLKANGLPESMVAHAKQRTQQIIEAYELIRERRGMAR